MLTIEAIKTPTTIRTKLDDEYYRINLGAFNVCNVHGVYYPEGAMLNALKNTGYGSFGERLERGQSYGEWGHPNFIGVADKQFTLRCMKIDEQNISHFIKKIEIRKTGIDSPVEPGKKRVDVIGILKPAGPKGPILQKSLDDDSMNTAFSARGFADNKTCCKTGKKIREVKRIITFDAVLSPGIACANKNTTYVNESSFSKDIPAEKIEESIQYLHDSKRNYQYTESIDVDINFLQSFLENDDKNIVTIMERW